MIGLSGLITPSLDEMVNVAARDAAPGLHDPAADRRRHHVARAHRGQGRPASTTARWSGSRTRRGPCRSRPPCSTTEQRDEAARRRAGRLRRAARPPRRQERPAAGDAGRGPRQRRTPIEWSGYRPPRPRLLLQQDHDVSPDHRPAAAPTQHVRVFPSVDLAELRRYIDWQPFFNAWEMKGSFPDILDRRRVGRDRAQALRRRAGDARPDRRRGAG